MLLLSVFRVGGFIVNAALIFLLMPREPQLDWTEGSPTVWQRTRQTVFSRLESVRAELDHAGDLRRRVPAKLSGGRVAESEAD